jgi:hypothetical protein
MQRFITDRQAIGFAVIGIATLGCEGTQKTGPSEVPAQLRVQSVAPNTGTAGQETPIRVNGTGFESGATLSLDNVVVPSTFVSSTLITAAAPAHAAGAIDVAVTNPGGRASRLERGFTYVLRLPSLSLSGNIILTAVGDESVHRRRAFQRRLDARRDARSCLGLDTAAGRDDYQTSGTIRVRVTWTDAASTMNLWLNRQMFAPTGQREILVDLPITGGVESQVYVGKIAGPIGNYVTSTFTVSPRG